MGFNSGFKGLKSPISNFTEIRPVGAALIHVDRRTDGDDEAIKHFSRLCDHACKSVSAV